MKTAIIIFMILVVLMIGLIIGVLIYDLLSERKKAQAAPEKPAQKPEPAPAPVHAEVAAAGDEPKGNVTFSADAGVTHEEKYHLLPEDARAWYDEIAAYAAAVQGAKRYMGKHYEEYKIGSRKIVRFSIKRGVTVCQFLLQNSDFHSYVSENKISVSSAPTSMKVTDASTVLAAKGAIDIVKKSIDEEKELKRRLANERRRQKYAEQTEHHEKEAESAS